MLRHLLVPFLLGFKFNLASLIPLLFGFLLLLTKKAMLLTKIALIISGLLGWNTLFSSASGPYPGGGFHGFHTQGPDTSTGGFPYHDYQTYQHRPYRVYQTSSFEPYNQHVIREVVDVYDNAETGTNKRNGKNFVWAKGS